MIYTLAFAKSLQGGARRTSDWNGNGNRYRHFGARMPRFGVHQPLLRPRCPATGAEAAQAAYATRQCSPAEERWKTYARAEQLINKGGVAPLNDAAIDRAIAAVMAVQLETAQSAIRKLAKELDTLNGLYASSLSSATRELYAQRVKVLEVEIARQKGIIKNLKQQVPVTSSQR